MSDVGAYLAAAVGSEPGDAVEQVELHRVRLRTRRPHRAAHGTEVAREVIIVRVRDAAGCDGWGECPTLGSGYGGEDTDTAWRALEHRLAPALVAGVFVADGSMAAAALVDAMTDRVLRRDAVGFAALLGVAGRSVPSCAVLDLPPSTDASGVDDVVARAGWAIADGAAALKLKIRPGWSTEPVRAVLQIADRVPVAVDANGSFALGSAELRALDALGLAYVEQPCAPGVPPEVLELTTPVALDESLSTPTAVLDWLAADGRQVGRGRHLANVKPSRQGGVVAALALLEAAADLPGTAYMGGMLESGIGRSSAVALAARAAELDPSAPSTDLGPSVRYVDQDVTAEVAVAPDGGVQVPDVVGLGAAPEPARLAAMTVHRVVVQREA